MIHIYLCDDNPAIIAAFGENLNRIAEKHGLGIHITAFGSGEQLLFHWEDAGTGPDIIFLDIVMTGDNGLETARKLRGGGCRSELIFLTANPEYVFDSFDVSPANYILKSQITEKKLEEIFLKAVASAVSKAKMQFQCENGSVKKNIPVCDISYFEVRNRMVTVFYDNTSFDFYSSLEDVQQKLSSPDFVRIHRSYLVNLLFVEQMEPKSVLLSGGCHLPLGITYVKKVKESMNRYFALMHK